MLDESKIGEKEKPTPLKCEDCDMLCDDKYDIESIKDNGICVTCGYLKFK